jgi:hypothetical protein
MLTSGKRKNETFQKIIRSIKRGPNKKVTIHMNMDKSRWGPSFIPIQFIYMFKHFKQLMPSMFRLITMILINHTNKRCLIPEELIRLWKRYPTKKHYNVYHFLQKLKDNFFDSKDLYIKNESNMGQGILHYTSSYLHILLLEFRNELFRRLIMKYGDDMSIMEWRDIVSSDDSYTALQLQLQSPRKMKKYLELFMVAQEMSERLFSVKTSKAKTSISFILCEFNSLFGSNLTFYPTTFKFALSSVQPVNTVSFFRMVKESYNTCRQIVENGGTLELFGCAHKLNKVFCESIYHTGESGHNSPLMFGIRSHHMPYHLGHYPIGDYPMMLILGP